MNEAAARVHGLVDHDRVADETAIRRAQTRFVATSLLIALMVAAVAWLAIGVLAERRAEDDARSRAAVVAAVAGAWFDSTSDPTRRAELSAAIREVGRHEAVNHVIVWRADGSVVWADDPDMVGQQYSMEVELQAMFTATEPAALVGRPHPIDLEGARAPADVLGDIEIFSPTTGVDDEPLVVESYVDKATLTDHRRDTSWTLVPYVAAVLLLVEGACLVLGASLVRQVRRARQDQRGITTRALRSLEVERRELAHGLHDGVVQDLAATRYAIASIAATLPDGLPQDPQGKLQRIQDVLQDELHDLRGLLGHLTPPDLERRSLDQALRALVRHVVPVEVSCRLAVTHADLTTAEATMVYRVVREGLTNAVKHAGATQVRVGVAIGAGPRPRDACQLTVVVEDDGRGPGARSPLDVEGHFGLGLLAGLLDEQGGSIVLTRDDSTGWTCLRARVTRQEPARV